jgi:hypothetical protein
VKRIPKWCSALVATFAIYFPAAVWLKATCCDTPRAPEGIALRIARPFEKVQDAPLVAVARLEALDDVADTEEHPERSPFLLYENTLLLGPPHSFHDEIRENGMGRYSHWRGLGLLISSSDGTDPKSNGRTYWLVRRP